MKKLWNKFFGNTTAPKKGGDIVAATNRMFDKYEKSFKDLARYDRGEKIGN